MNIKKIICLFMLIAVSLLCLSSCTNGNVKSVKIDGKTYITCYLYYFEEADISGYSSSIYDKDAPTESGYVYSNQKLSVGDVVEVWNVDYFNNEEEKMSSFGTTATVKKIIGCYPVKVKRNKETYTITHFGMVNEITATELSDMEECEKSMIELTKDRVAIEYYAD